MVVDKYQIWCLIVVAAALFFPQMNCNGSLKLDQENTDDKASRTVNRENQTLKYNIQEKSKHPVDMIRGPFGANFKSSYIETVIVIDNSLFRSFGKNVGSINQYCKDLISVVNSIYSPFNLFIVLTDVVIWRKKNKIIISNDSGKTLDNFLKYRETKLSKNYPSDLGIILTNHTFDKSVIGKAYVQVICSIEHSGVLVSKHSLNIALVASTIAHEIGHVLGLSHDENVSNCKCQAEKCIMSEVIHLKPIIQWSICSKKQYLKSISSESHLCLKNKPKKIFDPSKSYCGNGFVEPGEECDCGLALACKNECCNPKTCKLNANALCGTGDCCDLNTCQIMHSDHRCRGERYCNGVTEFCPPDIYNNATAIFDRDNPCSYNCNENGMCNEKGICECFEEFEPPFCIENNENSHFDMWIYIILCCIVTVTSILVLIFVIHAWFTMKRHNEEANQQIFDDRWKIFAELDKC